MKTRLALILCTAGLAACGSDGVSGPRRELTGTFVLRSVDGLPLPAKANRANAAEFTLVADTIRMYDDGSGTEVAVRSEPNVSGVTTQTRSLKVYRTAQDSVIIDYPCNAGPLALCIGPPYRGIFTPTGVIMSYSIAYRAPLVFTRIVQLID